MQINIKKIELELVYLIPLINVIVALIVPRFYEGYHLSILIRAFILISFCFYFVLKRGTNNPLFTYSIVYILYFLLLIALSPNLFSSLYVFTQIIIITLLLPIGYQYLNTIDKLIRFQKNVFSVFVIVAIYIIYANIFRVGISAYGGESYFTGNLGVNITKDMMLGLFAMPILFIRKNTRATRMYYLLFSVFFFVLIVLGLKRSAVLGLIFGYITFIYIYPKYPSFLKYSVLVITVLVLTSPFYIERLYERLNEREDAVAQVTDARTTITEGQSRFGEFYHVVKLVTKENYSLFFGMLNPFLTSGIYPTGGRRVLHVDYSVYLFSGGLIGLLLFLGIYVTAIYTKNRAPYFIKNSPLYRELNAVFYSLIIAALILSIAGGYSNIGLRGLLMLYLGGLSSVMSRMRNPIET